MAAWPQVTMAILISLQLIAWIIKDLREPTFSERAAGLLASIILVCGQVALLWAGGWWLALG